MSFTVIEELRIKRLIAEPESSWWNLIGGLLLFLFVYFVGFMALEVIGSAIPLHRADASGTRYLCWTQPSLPWAATRNVESCVVEHHRIDRSAK